MITDLYWDRNGIWRCNKGNHSTYNNNEAANGCIRKTGGQSVIYLEMEVEGNQYT